MRRESCMYWGMADNEGKTLLRRILETIGLREDEIAAGHGALPDSGSRPSTQSRRRSREHQRQRSSDEDSEKAAEAIAEAAAALDEQIRRSVDEPGGRTSEEMVEKARKRWSND